MCKFYINFQIFKVIVEFWLNDSLEPKFWRRSLSQNTYINFIFRHFKSKDCNLYLRLYSIYIEPIISYGISLYGAASLSNVNSIEKILKYFTKRLWNRLYPLIPAPCYLSRLSKFNLTSIELNRIRSDFILFFKILRNFPAVPSLSITFSKFCSHRVTVNLIKSKSTRRFFLHRTSMLWNKLVHDNSFNDMSVHQFKAFVNSLNLTPHFEGRALEAP